MTNVNVGHHPDGRFAGGQLVGLCNGRDRHVIAGIIRQNLAVNGALG